MQGRNSFQRRLDNYADFGTVKETMRKDMKPSENFPNCKLGNMLILTLEEFRNQVVDFYAGVIEADAKDMLSHGNTGSVGKMMQLGVENMSMDDLIEIADAWLNITMDCDTELDGIIVWHKNRSRVAVLDTGTTH
jgi:hypothetical protein